MTIVPQPGLGYGGRVIGKPKVKTLGAKLRSGRRFDFVGRTEEQAWFRAALERSEPAILWIFAPGGVGKTTLIRKLGEIARASGATCIELDLASMDASPAAILGELERPLAGEERSVLLLDSYERGDAIDGWFRQALLPALPEDVIVVLAGRNPPSLEWRMDPEAGALLQPMELQTLDGETSRALLVSRGVAEDRAQQVVGLARGHALALVLLAEVVRAKEHPVPTSLREVPQVVAELVGHLVREIESPDRRRALELCAHARRTTEDLLRVMLGEGSAHELLTWLRGLPYVSARHDGVALHPVVRDAVDEDLRWRDPPGYRALHVELARHLIGRVQAAPDSERERAFLDLLYLKRASTVARRVFDFDSLGSGWAETPRADEREAVAALIEAHDGQASGRIARYWFDRERERFTVLRGPLGDPVVVSLHLVLTEIPGDARALDPAMEEIHRMREALSPSHEGRRIIVSRFLTGRDPASDGRLRHHRPLLLLLTTPHLELQFTAVSNGARFAGALAEAGHRCEGGFTIDGRSEPIFVGDFRQHTPADWALSYIARDLDGSGAPDDAPRAEQRGLDRQALGTALRHALENFTRADQLESSPLLQSRWLRRGAGEAAPSPQVLRQLLREAIATMDAHPRDAKLARALDAAFLHPAPSREAAADRIDVPFSTFRRHLAKGIERLEEILWSLESAR